MANAQNVSTAKPPVGGAIYAAPIGTSLPTDTDAALTGFTPLGYVSDEGLTNTTAIESEKVKAWGGDTVLVTLTSKDDGFKFNLIESENVDVLKSVYGDNNVSGDLTTGISINVSSADIPEKSYVIDMILRGNTKKRIVVPSAKISAIEDIVYNDTDPIGYNVTTDCTPDSYGNTHYEYIKKPGVSG